MFPEIWSMMDRIFCNFGPFFPFYPYNTKYQNFEQLKNKPEDIIILHKCTKNHDHMSYCSLDMVRRGCQFYFLFWAIFSHFTSLTARKIKIKKKEKRKKWLEVSSFYNSAPKIMIVCYIFSETWQVTDVIIFHFGPFFALLPPYLTAQKIEILTKLKKTPEISSFYTGLSKIMITCYTVPEIWYVTDIIVIFHFGLFFSILQAKNVRFLRYDAQWTDGQMSGWTDGQMQKSDI